MPDLSTFTIHDASRLPAVFFLAGSTQPGYADQWVVEMEALMAEDRPFVVIHDSPRADEAPADRARRAVWLKANKAALGACCKGIVSIEADPARRADIEAMGQIAVKAFGIPHEVVDNIDDAVSLAHRLTGVTVIG